MRLLKADANCAALLHVTDTAAPALLDVCMPDQLLQAVCSTLP